MKIFLIGFMGAGKSTTGGKLAKLAGYEFADLDEIVEKNSNLSIAEIFEFYGEVEFRKLESEALKSILDKENIVVSTGGGVVLSKWNRSALKEGDSVVVYLQAEANTILKRLKDDDSRPLLKAGKADIVYKILSRRIGLYEALADIKIVTDEKNPIEIAENIVKSVFSEEQE